MKNLSRLLASLSVSALVAGCVTPPRPTGLTRMDVKSLKKLKELALACHIYAEKHDGLLPPSLVDAKPYFREDLAKDRSFDITDYDLLVSGKLTDVQRPFGEVILIRQKHPLRPGRYAVAFVDGHSEIIVED